MLTFREFDYSDNDYTLLVQLANAIWSEPTSEENIRYDDKVRPKNIYRSRRIIELDGTPVGYGGYSESRWLAEPNQYGFGAHVLPDHRKQGVGKAFYDFALTQMAEDGRTIAKLHASTREDMPDGVRYLQQNGFVQSNRYPRSELLLAQFDPAQFAVYAKRPAEHGLVIKQLSEIIPNDPQWQRKLYDLEWIFEQDEPTPDDPKQQPFEEYVKETLEHPEFMAEGWFMALDGNRFVGLSSFWPDKQKPHLIHTGWTGVDRPYRKKGMAMAMKLAAIEYAKARPVITTIRTDNHETNWMYQINLKLGFRPIPAYLSFEQTFS